MHLALPFSSRTQTPRSGSRREQAALQAFPGRPCCLLRLQCRQQLENRRARHGQVPFAQLDGREEVVGVQHRLRECKPFQPIVRHEAGRRPCTSRASLTSTAAPESSRSAAAVGWDPHLDEVDLEEQDLVEHPQLQKHGQFVQRQRPQSHTGKSGGERGSEVALAVRAQVHARVQGNGRTNPGRPRAAGAVQRSCEGLSDTKRSERVGRARTPTVS
jgi:hypothetical protein